MSHSNIAGIDAATLQTEARRIVLARHGDTPPGDPPVEVLRAEIKAEVSRLATGVHEREARAFAERLRSMASVHPQLRGAMLDTAESLDTIAGELYAAGCARGARSAGYPAVPPHAVNLTNQAK